MIFIIFSNRDLMGWEKRRYGEIFKKLIPVVRQLNKEIAVFDDEVRTEIKIEFK